MKPWATPRVVGVRQTGWALSGWLLACLVLPLILCPSLAPAAEIAILKSSNITAYDQAISGFRDELGGVATITEYDLEGDVARGRKLARKIRASDASLVVAVGLKAALVAKLEIVDVPVIYCMVLDPDKYDLRASNLTGLTLRVPVEVQFTTIRTLLPSVKKVGLLYDPEKTSALADEAKRAASRLGLTLIERQVRSEKDVPAALRGLIDKIEALWLAPDSTVLTGDSIHFVLRTTLDHNIPVVGFSSEFVRNGALAALSVNPEDVGKQVASMAKRLLASGNAISGNVQPDRVRLAVNLKTARYLGLPVPPDVIRRADEVY